jgi:hypothetical protein
MIADKFFSHGYGVVYDFNLFGAEGPGFLHFNPAEQIAKNPLRESIDSK